MLTGDIDHEVAAYWKENYDLNAKDRSNLGLPRGLLNRARELQGVQIGLLNYAGNNGRFPWLPLVNAHF